MLFRSGRSHITSGKLGFSLAEPKFSNDLSAHLCPLWGTTLPKSHLIEGKSRHQRAGVSCLRFDLFGMFPICSYRYDKAGQLDRDLGRQAIERFFHGGCEPASCHLRSVLTAPGAGPDLASVAGAGRTSPDRDVGGSQIGRAHV